MFVDIKDMPGYNPAVKNGVDCISTKKIYIETFYDFVKFKTVDWKLIQFSLFYPRIRRKPICPRHNHSIHPVDKYGIHRCSELECSNGCFEISIYRYILTKIKKLLQ